MDINGILSRLDSVKRTGDHSWVACCPGHDDKSPSLSIRETEDGKTLLHCFAGCQPREVVEAIGLQLHDLFPEKSGYSRPSIRPSITCRDRLICLSQEATVVLLAAERLIRGDEFPGEDLERLRLAARRISVAKDMP